VVPNRFLLPAAWLALTLAAAQSPDLISTLTRPMQAVANLVTVETWRPGIDELVQRAPAAASLGAKWTAISPAWQQARAAVAARLQRVLEAYAASDGIPRALKVALEKELTAAEAATLSGILRGPAGATIIGSAAQDEFVLEIMSRPDAPKPGGAAWMEDHARAELTFRIKIGPVIPRDKGLHDAEAQKFARDPLAPKWALLWMTVVRQACVAHNAAINLMLFDDREAIAREIAQAVATVK
jgi:hypothetical protein